MTGGHDVARAASEESDRRMKVPDILAVLGLALALLANEPATAQGSAGEPAGGPSAAVPGFEALKGTWIRPDGGYTIAIKAVGPNGEIDAMYHNPAALPFAKAQAVRQGTTLRLSFELQAGGYAGSTYELTFDPASDTLKGTYYQAVVKQKFDVYFERR
jgi:hypothetical protein